MADEKCNAAKEYLLQVKLLDALITGKQEDVVYLNAQITKITSSMKPDVVSGGGGQDKQELYAKLIDLRDEINRDIDNLIDKRIEVNKVIEQVKSPKQMRVLKLLYIGVWSEEDDATHYFKWREVAEKMHRDERTVKRIHGSALQAVEKILKDVPKCP